LETNSSQQHDEDAGRLSVCHYYVDEAGDPNIFNKRGRVIIGSEGCSRYFLLGFLEVPNPQQLSNEMHALHQELLNDPYFKNVPSMQPANRKTAVAFHAKDDPPEVRREVFRLLQRYSELKFFAAVKDKEEELTYSYAQQRQNPTYRYNANQLYEFLIWRSFKGCLHKADEYHVYFASRGNKRRTQALMDALHIARQKSLRKNNGEPLGPIHVDVIPSKHHYTLQAVDYFCWALIRFFEKREDRYLEYLRPQFRMIVDLSDKRRTGAGMHYSQKRPLTLSSLP
jgi:hypothetical protein